MLEPLTLTGDSAERNQLIDFLQTSLSIPAIRRRRTDGIRYRSSRTIWSNIAAGTKRSADTVIAGFAFIALLPLFLGFYLLAKRGGGGIARVSRLGFEGTAFDEWMFRFSPSGPPHTRDLSIWRKLPALINVLRGEMTLIGPRPFSCSDVSAQDRWAWKRFSVKPGLICLWWIRRRANIAYRSETEVDAEYVEAQSLRSDMGIALRSIPAALYGGSAAVLEDQVTLLGIPVNNCTIDQASAEIVRRSRQNTASQVCFVNADCVNVSYRDSEYKSILQSCGTVFADGIGVKLAGRLLKRNIRQNVNGTDLLPVLCEQMQEQGVGVYLLGGKPGVAEDLARWMKTTYPRLIVSGFQHGYFAGNQLGGVLENIKHSGANVLLVAMGAPKQEKWIRDNLGSTGCKVGMGVGGLFDFYSGRVPRAPVWMREIGMEWLFRFWQEPGRMWRRYFTGNLLFLVRVLFVRLAELFTKT